MLSRAAHAFNTITSLLLLPLFVLGQQPYHDWDAAYKAAEKIIATWSAAEVANVSARGTAPGYLQFTVTDGISTQKFTPHPTDYCRKVHSV